MITMILAMDKNNLVGCTNSKNGLCWHYPEDLKFYKNNTINKINIYGRNTIIAMNMVLKNRDNYCLTNDISNKIDGVKMISSIDEVVNLSNENNEIMICGGVKVFEQFNEICDKILLTKIDEEHSGDIYYNSLNLSNFKCSEIKKNGVLSFETWEKK